MDELAFHDPLTKTLVTFLNDIGLVVRPGRISERTFVPGIWIDHGVLVVDESSLRFPVISCTRPAIWQWPRPSGGQRSLGMPAPTGPRR